MTDVVVINYRTPGDLLTFCSSMKDQDIASLTIVNNSPGPIDVEVADSISEDMGARVINNHHNAGYARAANMAASHGTHEVVAIFNPDVVAPPGTVDRMTEFVLNHDTVGIAGPKQVDSRGRITHGGVTGDNRHPKLRGWHQRDHGQVDDVLMDVVSVSGSAFFVRRDCWNELTSCPTYQSSVEHMLCERAEGAFLPTQHYYEETACAYHARAHGWNVAYNGLVSMIHEWRGSSKDTKQLAAYTNESRKLFRRFCADHGIECD